MKIGLATGHLYNDKAGGFKAVKWHIEAFRALGHSVDVYTTNNPSAALLQNWFDGVPLRFYNPHVEKKYDAFIGIDHFRFFEPEAPLNLHHVFFPQDNLPIPPENIKIYSNSAYTARHIQHRWNREVVPMYIPIENDFYSDNKENIILHVSRITEPSEWADKAHRQMIQAFKLIAKQLPDWKFVIAGSVDPDQNFYFAELQRLAASYNIDFMPSLYQKTLIDLFARSSIYWHATGISLPNIPSAQEHMGITPLEAQASGCVPIVYNSGGMPEVVLNHQTGLLFDNALDLPNITAELVNNWSAWSQLSQAGKVWSKSWTDFNAFVGRIDDMLNDRPITPLKPFSMVLNHSAADVTAIIPTFNSPLLQQCLDSLRKTAPDMRVLVINNGESLSNLDVASNVTIYDAGSNLGFAGAHRLASQMVGTPFVLMLNDDILANKPGWLEHLLVIMNNPQVGVTGPKLLFPDGRLQFAGGQIDWNRPDIGFHRNYGGQDGVIYSTPAECDFITGAALLCRRELYEIPDELLGGLNYEDPWLCFAAREKGFKVVYQPASTLVHFEGETKKRTPEAQEKVERNKMEFVKRWRK